MKIEYIEVNGQTIAEIVSDDIIIHNAQDALELLVNCGYNGASALIMQASNLTPDFFELRTGVAGEVLQKFSTYRMRMAIVGDYTSFSSKSLKDFIFESNRAGRIIFVSSGAEARKALSEKG
ncbi:DUF4180 domain-containing protein [Rhodocytophaga rosea]|uniref:DUF4180 domain-containing protein n=1 Tax=Rhodocytophaga rosea TaxID=2704465 RepID=A0A6C0GJG8_9BACT|nr:DUF4180 domain-containing protein [Rhodocytophaga rosea]QHT68188.1 DUF4180 domain-containing protein [Rhodocytophaga rosea]